MADVKWIKITTDIFDDEKILLIESLPEADSIIVIWFKLLCLAGKMNNSGVFMMNDKIAYTDKMLATIFRRKESTVQLALKTFEQFGMVEIIDGVITIPNWGKHQNLEKLEDKKRYQREYQRGYRKKQRLLTEAETGGENSDSKCLRKDLRKDLREDLRESNVNRLDKEEDKDLEKDIREYKEKTGSAEPATPSTADSQISCQAIADLYNSICKSFPAVRSLSDARRKAIKARLKSYTMEDFKAVFENAEASSFLKGSNDRNWSANFDWLIKDSNMAKVLEGNYADKGRRYGRKEVPGWCQPTLGDAELEAIRDVLKEPGDPP